MTSWRETTGPQAQADMDTLLDGALGLAEQSLTKGTLWPFLAVITTEGEMEARMDGESEQSSPVRQAEEAVTALREQACAERQSLRAAALVLDVTMPDGSDAIQVLLEHAEPAAPALIATLPYRRGFGRRLKWGDLHAAAGERRFWD